VDNDRVSIEVELAHASTQDLVRELFGRVAQPSGRCKVLIEGENGHARFVDVMDVRMPMPALARYDIER
jgi:hypothetical protein